MKKIKLNYESGIDKYAPHEKTLVPGDELIIYRKKNGGTNYTEPKKGKRKN